MEPQLQSKTESLSPILHAIGFEVQEVSPHRVTGRLKVNETCCQINECWQRFKVLNGGVSALIAETLASMGAHMASGFNRVAGVHLSTNHVKAAQLHDLVLAQATPISLGKTIQVWEVQLWKTKDSSVENDGILISSSKVTLICNMPVPKNAKDAAEALKKYAKL